MSTPLALASEGGPYSQLFNPDFEQDTDNVGFADGWRVEKNAEITLTREDVASGTRALVITKGYNAVSQDLDISGLAGKRMNFSIEARSPDSARLGVRMGHYMIDSEGKKKWRDVPVIWNRELGPVYETLNASFMVPKNAEDGRFWICIYRSQNEGTVIVDNLSLEFLDQSASLGTKDSTVLLRERNYLLGKLKDAKALQPNNPKWDTIKAEADAVMKLSTSAESVAKGVAPLLETYQGLNAQLLEALHPSAGFTAVWKDAFERVNPEKLPATEGISAVSTALAGEHTAFGVELANTTQQPKELTVELSGEGVEAASEIEMRRQVLMETWYTKGATLMADALTALPGGKTGWKINLEPGETTRLYVDLKLKDAPKDAKLKGQLTIRDGKREEALPFEVNLIAQARPTTPEFAHYQFLYVNQNVANRVPEKTSADLVAHGVTDIEWAFKPTATFSPEGELLRVGFGAHTRWLQGFKDSNIRFNLFWMKNLPTEAGGELAKYGPEWQRAWGELHKAYLNHAESLGIDRKRITSLPMDEIHSKSYEKAPDENITNYIEVANGLRKALPELPQYLTVGNYAFPADIKAVADKLDVAIIHWPRPEKMSRNAPPGYEARKDFFENSLPVLEGARKNGKLKLWSYHVQSGRNGEVLKTCLAYPIFAVISGYTGFGYWAYNVSAASTWNDTDGKILDYCLVYDGAEGDPQNLKYNVTQEDVVPSVRWKAIRSGQQDAQILLYLMEKAKEEGLSQEKREKITKVVDSYQKLAGEYALGTPELTYEAIRQNAVQLREVYAAVASAK
jgi:hypothetical protein